MTSMNDRTLDNQFPANQISQEQLRQMHAALTGQAGALNNNLGLLGSNLNLLNPIALQNLLPLLTATNSVNNTNTTNNNNDSPQNAAHSTSQQQQFPPRPQHQSSSSHQQPHQQQQQQQQPTINTTNLATGQVNLLQAAPQNLSFKRRGRKPKQMNANASSNSLIPSTGDVTSAAGLFNNFPLPQSSINDNNNTAGGGSTQLEQTMMILKQQSDRRWQQQEQRQRHQQQQQQQQMPQPLISNEFTQRLSQQLQQLVRSGQQQQQQQQPHSSTLVGDQASLTIRQQQQTLQNFLPQGALPTPPEQKRKRGRPPLSAPSTSTGSGAVDLNYLNMIMKSQQDRDRVQRDLKLQQERRQQQERERQRELRLAQEQRQREFRLQQERERERIEMERQRKAQHRMAIQDIDRERRRQHMIMVRNLDSYKRNEEREKTMEAMIIERNKQNERRMYQKRLETELIKDIRKSVDDMMLKNQKPLATLNRIPGLKLPGKAFADLLMSFEFLFNFGETLGLELKEIPDIDTLQMGLLNINDWAESILISLVHHLCMFAIKDPRFPYSGSLKEIENLEQTNEGLSQLLHFYLQVLTLNAKTEMEHEFRLYKLIEQKYFLSLNATQKAEMLAFICNELLCSQTVTKQMEDTIENVAKFRKDKWVLENELRKYRVIKNKRELKEEALLKAREAAAAATAAANAAAAAAANENEDQKDVGDKDKPVDSKVGIKTEPEDGNKKATATAYTNGSSSNDDVLNRRELDLDAPTQPNITNDLDDMEPGMTNDELNKKIENLTRQYNKMSNKLEKAINSMRACPLGQDRYRRRYWVLPQVGGVFVEGMESAEPEELENNKFTEEELMQYEKEQQALNELANNDVADPQEENPEKMEIKEDKESEDMDIKVEGVEVKDEDEAMEIKEEDQTNNSEIKEEFKVELNDKGQHEIDKNANEANCDVANASAPVTSIPWFSILPRISCDFTKIQEDVQTAEGEDNQKRMADDQERPEIKAELTSEELRAMRYEICPALAKRLEELEAEQYESPKKIHPQFQCGWWRITDAQQLKTILNVLHERGARERQLHKHLTKHFQYACNSCKNLTVDFGITSWDRRLAGQNYGAPVAHTDDDSADEVIREGEEEDEEEEEEEEVDEDTGDDKATPQVVAASSKKSSKRKRVSRSARSRRLRARAAARKKVENSRSRLAQR